MHAGPGNCDSFNSLRYLRLQIMEWFVILLALGVAIGPILYLMPSDRDRYLTSLRALARKLGYTVQLDKVLKLDPTDDERVTAGGGMRQPALSCAATNCLWVSRSTACIRLPCCAYRRRPRCLLSGSTAFGVSPRWVILRNSRRYRCGWRDLRDSGTGSGHESASR